MIFTFLCLGLLSLDRVFAATIPPSSAIFASSLDNAALTNLSKGFSFQYTGPVIMQEGVRCDGANYGTRLDLQSCDDALRGLDGDDTRTLTFGQRGVLPRAQQTLPFRRSSGDGRCVIDVVHSSRGPARDAATSLMIKEAAARVVHFCVNGGQGTSRGGYVGHIGLNGNLVVIVRKYEPNVQCGRRWNGFGDCKQVLDRLPVYTLPEVFGPPGMMGVNVMTPSIWNLGSSTCRVRVDNIPLQKPDTGAWFDIWAAGEAVNAICSRARRDGLARDLGNNKGIAVSLLDETPRSVQSSK
ncbi:hypothetical protein XPA_010665 [Xanthoria parietina]